MAMTFRQADQCPWATSEQQVCFCSQRIDDSSSDLLRPSRVGVATSSRIGLLRIHVPAIMAASTLHDTLHFCHD